ncbi:MAG: hypothetical protein R2824_09170 [Saprospiraceae bacterium]|nr:hypothetical protein [Lewinella sp.]
MRKILAVLILFALCASVTEVAAQKRSGDDEYFDESGNIGHRIWLGSHFTLGYRGTTFYSLFEFGLSPMVGFKINDIFSIGPRGSILYNNYRESDGVNNVYKLNTSSWAVGVFGRVRPFPTFFAQLEYNLENRVDWVNTTRSEVSRLQYNSFYIGGGYNAGSGGPIAFEALLMYNVNQPVNVFESPLSYRVGITYKY